VVATALKIVMGQREQAPVRLLERGERMKTNIARRILQLELGAGLIETEESRRMREAAQAILRSRAARRASEGLPPEKLDETPWEGPPPRTAAEAILGARRRRMAREAADQQRIQQAGSTRESTEKCEQDDAS